MARCWMLSRSDICFVHLGKYGDLALMLPGFKAVADETGQRPIVIVSREFAPILEGVSYVRPWVVDLHWWKGVGEARRMAEEAGYRPYVIKWWDEPGAQPPRPPADAELVTIRIHGREMRISAQDWDSYQASQWRYAGFTMKQMTDWPLVFDRRSPEREERLRQQFFSPDMRHLLVNLSREGTSPIKLGPQIMSFILGTGLKVVDLSRIRAHRIYDLLGLYDHAAGLITSDTATLHLAAASKIPYIAFINDKGRGSIPKGNCILSVRYSQCAGRLGFFVEALQRIVRNVDGKPIELVAISP